MWVAPLPSATALRIVQAMRIVVADDSALLRQGLVELLDRFDDLDVVGECGTLDGLRAATDERRPDVVVTDIRMPPTGTTEGLEAASWIAAEHPATGVVVLSQHVTPDYALRLLQDGPPNRAYLLKERVSDIDELAHAIRQVHGGGSVIDPLVVEALVAASRRDDSALEELTTRELDVLSEMATGKSNAAIAAVLHLSERSIEKHSNAIFSKLGFSEEPTLNRRVAAVIVYLSEQRSNRA